MSRRSFLAIPLAVALAVAGKRLVPGPLASGATLLPSGWRIRPAGRQVSVGNLPLNLVTLSDGSLIVTNNGNGQNGLMAINPGTATIAWKHPLRAAWLGLARSGPSGADTIWASGGGINQVYRFTRSGAEWHSDTATLADTSARLFAAGLAVVPAGGLIAVVGNLSDSVYLIETHSLARHAAFPVGHRPYTVVADSGHLYVSNWGDSTVSVIDLTARPPFSWVPIPPPSRSAAPPCSPRWRGRTASHGSISRPAA